MLNPENPRAGFRIPSDRNRLLQGINYDTI